MRFGKAQGLARAALNALQQLQFREAQKTFVDFSGGYISAMSREQVPETASPNMLDMEVSYAGRLRVAPGTSAVETPLAHATTRIAIHASLDLTAEILFLAPPYVGVRKTTSTTWVNVGMGDWGLSLLNFGGTMILCDGTKVWKREANSLTFERTNDIPVAGTYAAFAGRLWCGNAVIDGDVQPMGVSWSDTTSDPESWDMELGAGFELLINDLAAGDEVVALRPMGLDFMAIMCRKSLWVARRTGLVARPADLQPRVSGVGALTDKATVLSRFGVFFLTHTGVHLFDGNNAIVVSDQINADILPLDLAHLDEYGLYFNPVLRRLYLFTPSCTWVFEVEKGRWFKWSMIAKDGLLFAEQYDALTWGELVGSWGSQTVRWKDFSPEEGNASVSHFLSADGLTLHKEDKTSRQVFGVAMNPYWDTPLVQQEWLDRLITMTGVTVEYAGSGRIRVWTPDNYSAMKQRLTLDLSSVVVPDFINKGFTSTGRGVGARVQVLSGSPEILKIQLLSRGRGSRVQQL